MGAQRFESHGASFGIDWSQAPFTPAAVVEAWRDAHPKIAGYRTGDVFRGNVIRQGGLWREMERAADQAVRFGRLMKAGRCEWMRDGNNLVCVLPSGRHMVFRDAQIETVPTPWGGSRQAVTYAHHHGRVSTFGGKLVENVTQAMCRDLLADALVRLAEAGIESVLHVHDEVVNEVSDATALAQIKKIMESPPSWAEGFPIKVEGYVAKRYRK